MTTIAAKPTIYAGVRFRSRLEARWAAFFDAIGREWLYEPEVPELAGLQYQPDFLTTTAWSDGITLFEVKPHVDGQNTVKWLRDERWHEVANRTQCSFVLLFGTPGEWLEGRLIGDGHFGALFRPDAEVVPYVEFAECLTCNKVNVWTDGVATCHKPLPSGLLRAGYEVVRDMSFSDAVAP